jgi:hypothetical protein
MQPHHRIATSLPLQELWNKQGPLEATRKRDLTQFTLQDRLRTGPFLFVVADAGLPLEWVDSSDYFLFWKSSVRDHLCVGDRFFLDDYAGDYCFVASEWELPPERWSWCSSDTIEPSVSVTRAAWVRQIACQKVRHLPRKVTIALR